MTTKAYTFKVTMLVQVLSNEDENHARNVLDKDGGFISDRQVESVGNHVLSFSEL